MGLNEIADLVYVTLQSLKEKEELRELYQASTDLIYHDSQSVYMGHPV